MTPKRPKRETFKLKGELAGVKFPNLRKVKSPLYTMSNVHPMTFGNKISVGHTYFARELDTDIWETCTMKDIANPDYKPFLAIPSAEGYAVWDVEKEIPVYCSDRGIFKQYVLEPEDAVVTNENILLNANGHKGMAGSLIFFKDFVHGIKELVTKIAEEEFIEEFGDLTKEPDLNL